jgi:hypothetical protein
VRCYGAFCQGKRDQDTLSGGRFHRPPRNKILRPVDLPAKPPLQGNRFHVGLSPDHPSQIDPRSKGAMARDSRRSDIERA